jgi:hypothetical protein
VDNEARIVWLPDQLLQPDQPLQPGQSLQPFGLAPGKKWHFFICHHQGSGGDQARILCTDLEKRGFRVWYDNRRAADHRNLEGMKRGVRESEVFLIFLSGRKETSGQPDLNGEYEGPFTRWFCQEEMTAAHEAGLRCVGVKEDDERFGKPDFALEKSRSSSGKDGGPIHERAAMNARILDEICFIDFRRQQHEMKGMIDEVVRQRTCAPVLCYTEVKGSHTSDPEPEPEPEPELAPERKRRRAGLSAALIGLAVLLLVIAMVVRSEETPPSRREVVITNGTAPPCADDEYLLDHLCHTCEDCVPGQMCSVHGALPGCHDCPVGRYDDDFNEMTKCIDCLSGETSAPQSTGCEEADDVWDNLVGRLSGLLEVVATILGLVATLRELGARNCCSRADGGRYEEIDRGAVGCGV